MTGSGKYRNYRGRTPKWKAALAVFLVLVILASGLVILLQRYIVYDETGTPQLQLPDAPAQQVPDDGPGEVDLTIEKAEEVRTEIRAFSVPVGPLTLEGWDSAWLDATVMSAPGYNASVFTVKDAQGHVYLDTAAAVSGVVVTAADTDAALEKMTGGDSSFYTIARLSCFHDPKAANADVEDMGLQNTGGYIFYDGNNSQWLDPGKPAARAYLCALAKEAAERGFDEILLTDVGYPTEGKLDKIAYGDGTKEQDLLDFLAEMRLALEPTGAALSIELPETVLLDGRDDRAGLVLAEIAPIVDRVYAVTAPEQIGTLSAAVTAAGEETDFVPELAEHTPEVTGSCVIGT